MLQLNKTIAIIKGLSGKIFVPITISNSPLNPDSEMFVIMREADNTSIIGMDVSRIKNENLIEKRYQILPI